MFEIPDFHYDSDDVTRFFRDKTKGNVIECAAVESLNFCKEYIKSEKVLRDDRKELTKLLVAYLSSGGVKLGNEELPTMHRSLEKPYIILNCNCFLIRLNFFQKINYF